MNWTDLEREDLKMIPYALELGYDLKFHYEDIKFKRTTPDNIPSRSVGFILDPPKKQGYVCTYMWQIIKHDNYSWNCADLENNHWVNHRWYATLKDALDAEKR